VRAPCDSNDAGLCEDARAEPQITIGDARANSRSNKVAATQHLSEGSEVQMRNAQGRSSAVRNAAKHDASVSSMMLSAMGKNPEPYEERKLARREAVAGAQSPGLFQMMKGVWAGEANVGAEWQKCGHGAINCPPPEMGGYAAREPYNHISGEYAAPEYAADPVRAHYRKRLDGQADARDYYNDDIVTPIRHNYIEKPAEPDPSYKVVDYKPHEGFDPENETAAEIYHEKYHLVRWDKEKWKEVAEADAQREEARRARLANGEDEDEDEDEEADEADEPTSEDVREEEEEEEDETGLRPGTLTMRPGVHPKGVTWEGIARKRLNDTFSGTPEHDGSHEWDISPLDDRDDQGKFLEYEPQHMRMKSLDGYYKTTPKTYMDFRGVHPWSNTEDRDNHHGPLMRLERDVADVPNNEFNFDMDMNSDAGHLPGVVLDSWGAVDTDTQSRPSPSNDFIATEPASQRIAREHRVIISDQEMNEQVGAGGLMGRDQGGSTDDTWVEKHHAHRTIYPTSADPGTDLTGKELWH